MSRLSVDAMRMWLKEAAMDVCSIGGGLEEIAENFRMISMSKVPWYYPVGSPEYPVEKWYIATRHDLTGRTNDGYGHTGIDLNVQVLPRGDVDRGQPVFAVADAVVVACSYSHVYLGSIIICVSNFGVPLYVRYWHLADDDEFSMPEAGEGVVGGQQLGVLGNYTLGAGGDHLHFDMAMEEFSPHWWWTKHEEITWVNPLLVLKTHLDPAVVDAMCSMSD